MMKNALFLAGFFCAALVACGGDDTTVVIGTPVTRAPGGLYVGYYQEDPATNPEDPMMGTLFLNLPQGNADFSGKMSFTYVGCQTTNVGTISGNKTDKTLNGTWSGTVDGSAQSGLYQGTYDAAKQVYSGTYTNSGGKQYRDLRPCIEYTIAPNGSWELFATNTTVSSDSNATGVSISGNVVTWYTPAATQYSLVSVLDKANALSSTSNAIAWQGVVSGATKSVSVDSTVLVKGRTYIVGVGSSNGSVRTYYSSKEFVAQ